MIVDREKINRAFSEVFASKDPFSNPFSSKIEEIVVFCYLDGFNFTDGQFQALVSAIKVLEEKSYYYLVLESKEDEMEILNRNVSLLIEDLSFETYGKIANLPLEYSLFSFNGSWGTIHSHEMHALIGGSRKFVDAIKSFYPEWKNDYQNLLNYWEGNPNRDWISEIENCGKLKI